MRQRERIEEAIANEKLASTQGDGLVHTKAESISSRSPKIPKRPNDRSAFEKVSE